jgi:hypothetical protein
MGYGVLDLTPRTDTKDRARLDEFLASAPRYPTLLLRRQAANLEAFTGFWPAALEAGLELKALGSVENNATLVWGEDHEAITALANDMARRVLNRSAEGGTHQLAGDERVIETYWRTFAKVGRARVVNMDRKLRLAAATQDVAPPKPDITVEAATESDLKIVYAFTGDYAVENWGVDPRRMSPQAHEQACRQVIAEGRQLVGKDRGRPVFVAELAPLDSEGWLLDKVQVPRPFRVRKKMVASALVGAARLARERVPEVLAFVDVADAALASSFEMAGFVQKRMYRWLVMRS